MFATVRKLHFAPKMNLKMNKNLNLYLTANTLCPHYKDQAVNPFTKILFVVIIRGKSYSYNVWAKRRIF